MAVYFGNKTHDILFGKRYIEKIGTNDTVSYSVYGDEIPVNPINFLLTINTDPADATVYINNIEGNIQKIIKDSVANYTVSKTGYLNAQGSILMDEPKTLDVVLNRTFKQTSSMSADGVIQTKPTASGYSFVDAYNKGATWDTVTDLGYRACDGYKGPPTFKFPYPIYVKKVQFHIYNGATVAPGFRVVLYDANSKEVARSSTSYSGTKYNPNCYTAYFNGTTPCIYVAVEQTGTHNNWKMGAFKLTTL
jgi:hypothetical protein